MWQQIAEIYAYREMLRNLVARELRARYKGSVLGFLWTFFNPLFMLVVYSAVFSHVMRVQVENYAMFLFVALLPWNYFAQSVQQAAASLVQNAGLVKKIYFPRAVLPLAVVLANLFNYLFGLGILIPALLAFKIRLTPALLAFPAVLFVQTLLVAALALLVAAGNVYFRDLEHIVGIALMAWFFLTPVLYPLEAIPPGARGYFLLNPMTPVVDAYRAVFFYGAWPDWGQLWRTGLGGLAALLVALAGFVRWQRAVAEEI